MIQARVIGLDGRVSTLDQQTVSEGPARQEAPDVYTDSRVLKAPLPSLQTGCVVEYTIVVSDRTPLMGAGSLDRVWFGHADPVLSRRLLIDCPAATPLRYAIRGRGAFTPVRLEAKGRITLRFDAKDLPGLKEPEPLLNSDDVPVPCIDFSTGTSWNDVARSYAAVTDPLLDGGPLKEYATTITGTTAVPGADVVAAMLNQVRRDVRYTGINFGENAIIPHPPLETLKRGYGDCKDQAVLLVAALRAAGTNAQLALLKAGDSSDVSTKLPGLALFNHVIVYLPDKRIWIDPTANFFPPGELPPMDRGRHALVIARDTTALVLTPESSPSQNWLRELREVTLGESGPASVTETTTMGGSFEPFYRDSFNRRSSSATHDRLEDYAKKEFQALALETFSTSDPQAIDVPFTLTVKASEAKVGFTDESSAVASLNAANPLSFLPDFLTRADTPGHPFTRTGDMRLWQPYACELIYHIVAPPGYRAAALPSDETVPVGPAILTKAFKVNDDGSITATLRFDCGKLVYTPDETIATHQAVRAFIEKKGIVVRFEQIGESLLAAGKYREALDEFRGLAKLHPREALHKVQISRALLAAGFGSDALAEARAAVDLQPQLARAHGNLAWVLSHDDFGRLLTGSVDIADARAEYERARQLEPTNFFYSINLAVLDEYNDSLIRFGPGAKLEDAVSLYRSLEKNLDAEHRANLYFDLLSLGGYQDIKRDLEESASTTNLQALFVAAVAALDGTGAAQKEAARLVPAAEDRSKVLGVAAQFLLKVRRYPECAELMVAGARGSPNLTQTLAFAELLKTLSPTDRKLLNDKSPQGIIFLLMSLITSGEVSSASLDGVMASSVRASLSDPSDRAEITRSLEFAHETFSRLPFSLDTLLDIIVRRTTVQTIVEGNAMAALVVVPGSSATKPMIAYLTKEGDDYRIVDVAGTLSGIGRECLALLDAGRIDDARAWFRLIRRQHAMAAAFPDVSRDPIFTLISSDEKVNLQPAAAEAKEKDLRLAAGYALARSRSRADARLGASLILPLWRTEKDAARRLTLEKALAEGLLLSDQMTDLEEVASSFVQDAPGSMRATELLCIAMDKNGKSAEATAFVRSCLMRKPGDPGLTRLLAKRLASAGEYAEAVSIMVPILDSGSAEVEDYNLFVWYSLFTGRLDAAVMEKYDIVQRLNNGNPGALHTLACFLGDSGRIMEAQEVFGKYLQQSGRASSDPSAWLVYGIMAKRFGLIDTAISAFHRVSLIAAEAAYPGMSTWALAQLQLGKAVAEKR